MTGKGATFPASLAACGGGHICCTWMCECRDAQDVHERRLHMDV